jgi:hypothetical protein
MQAKKENHEDAQMDEELILDRDRSKKKKERKNVSGIKEQCLESNLFDPF